MKALWAAAALAGLVIGSASAEQRYDRSIDRAAMGIVAQKIGDLRGGFSFDAKPALVSERKEIVKTGSIPVPRFTAYADPWRDGLALAVERRISRSFF